MYTCNAKTTKAMTCSKNEVWTEVRMTRENNLIAIVLLSINDIKVRVLGRKGSILSATLLPMKTMDILKGDKLSRAELTYGQAECPDKDDAEQSERLVQTYFPFEGVKWEVLETRYAEDDSGNFNVLIRANGAKCYTFNIFPYEMEDKKRRVMDKFLPTCKTDLNCPAE
ncbi:hypothetical protein X801_06872 [Opisthorchis viverrini]|uniref:Uncharacterized protein n=1 Tax=Opisthorchis viverrini TaxID=6198 RepID=A0A1S8WSD2_OPIVI|nr:hypothetical protein X801_06872 [Opisthorchis viverrini]